MFVTHFRLEVFPLLGEDELVLIVKRLPLDGVGVRKSSLLNRL